MPNDNLYRLLDAVNQRLRNGRIGVTLEVRGKNDMLYIRGTFPPKANSGRAQPYQQRHALKAKATPESIKEAERQCKLIGAHLNMGTFDWATIFGDEADGDRTTVGYWVQRFEETYWAERGRNHQTESTWRTTYQYAFDMLDSDRAISADDMCRAIARCTRANSSARRNVVVALSALALMAGLDPSPIKRLRGNYSAQSVEKKELPSDERIEETWQWLSSNKPLWGWIFGVIAAYGIRPHEIFYLSDDFSQFPQMQIADGGKTGSRVILPLHEDWADRWRLYDALMPRLKLHGTETNSALGNKIYAGFRNLNRSIPETMKLDEPYAYRHAWAVRARARGLDVDAAAHYLGHSPEVHRATYLRSAGERPYRLAYDRILKNH